MDALHIAFAHLDKMATETSPAFPQVTDEVEKACRTIGQAESIAYLVNRELLKAMQNPDLFEPRWMGSEVTVNTGNAITLAISHLDIETRLPFTLTSDMVIMPAHAGCDVVVECFELPPETELSIFNPETKPYSVWKKRVLPEGMLLLRAGQGVRFVVGHSSALLTITTRTSIEHAWYFDPISLAPVSIHSSSVSSAIAQTLSDFLGAYGDDSSIAAMESLIEHPAHFVRYSAARDLVRVSFAAGCRAFEKLLNDEHPHVRNSAAITIKRLSLVTEGE